MKVTRSRKIRVNLGNFEYIEAEAGIERDFDGDLEELVPQEFDSALDALLQQDLRDALDATGQPQEQTFINVYAENKGI